MFSRGTIRAVLIATCVSVVAPAGHCDNIPDPAAGPASSIEMFSQASQALYGKLSGSFIRVRVDPTYMTILTPPQRKEFLEWMRRQNAGAATDATTEQGAPPPTARQQRVQARNAALQAADPSAATMPAPRLGVAALFRKYIDQKIKDPGTDAATLARLRQAVIRLQQPVGETIGLVIDDQGDALILGGWVRDGVPPAVRVTMPDGRESNAKFLGANPGRGIAVLKLDSGGAAPAVTLAQAAPSPGEMLMCMTAGTGGVGWVAVPAIRSRKGAADHRFAVFAGEGQGASYLFNAKGQLAAVGFERYALPIDALRNDIEWIIENKKDVAPRQLGVKYTPVPPALRKSMRVLANRPAVVVDAVVSGSPADRAGLRKDDIVVSIDRRPIWQMAQIQWDMATQVDSVPIGIVRDDKELTLDLPLGDKP